MKVKKHIRKRKFFYVQTRFYISDFEKYINNLNTTERRCKKVEKKPLSEKQRQLLIRLIIAAISFVLGIVGVNSDVLTKVIEFVNTLI